MPEKLRWSVPGHNRPNPLLTDPRRLTRMQPLLERAGQEAQRALEMRRGGPIPAGDPHWPRLFPLPTPRLERATAALTEAAILAGLEAQAVRPYLPPERLAAFHAHARRGWFPALAWLLQQAQTEDWFQPAWEVVAYLQELWERGEYERAAAHLARIPAAPQGPGETAIFTYPILECLTALLGLGWSDDSILYHYQLELRLTEAEQARLRHCLACADFSPYEMPLCWLPEIAAMVTYTTGNSLLDLPADIYVWRLPLAHLRPWAELPLLRAEWQQARLYLNDLRHFCEWCDVAPERVRQALELVLQVGGYDL